jgi:hypothetical protein
MVPLHLQVASPNVEAINAQIAYLQTCQVDGAVGRLCYCFSCIPVHKQVSVRDKNLVRCRSITIFLAQKGRFHFGNVNPPTNLADLSNIEV